MKFEVQTHIKAFLNYQRWAWCSRVYSTYFWRFTVHIPFEVLKFCTCSCNSQEIRRLIGKTSSKACDFSESSYGVKCCMEYKYYPNSESEGTPVVFPVYIKSMLMTILKGFIRYYKLKWVKLQLLKLSAQFII